MQNTASFSFTINAEIQAEDLSDPEFQVSEEVNEDLANPTTREEVENSPPTFSQTQQVILLPTSLKEVNIVLLSASDQEGDSI